MWDARAESVNTGAWEGSVAHSGMSSITGSTRLPQLCHCPPLSHRPLTPLRTHQQDDQISLWDKRQPSRFTDKAEDKEKKPSFVHFLRRGDIFINKQHLMQGSSRVVYRHIGCSPFIPEKAGVVKSRVKPLAGGGWHRRWGGLNNCQRRERVDWNKDEMEQHRPDVFPR